VKPSIRSPSQAASADSHREHEPVVEAVGQQSEHHRADQQVMVPAAKQLEAVLEIRKLRSHQQAPEVQHVVECQVGRFGFVGIVWLRRRKAVIEGRRHHQGQRRDDGAVAKAGDVFAERPAEAADEEQHAEIKQRAQLEEPKSVPSGRARQATGVVPG